MLPCCKHFKKETAPRFINSLIKPKQADFSYGKNPGRTVSELGITGNNLSDFANNIHTEKNTIVQFTNDHTQYPVFKPKGSNSYSVLSPIYANGVENIAITGEGVFDGAGESWRPVKKSKVSEGYWSNLIKTGVISIKISIRVKKKDSSGNFS